MKTRIHLLPAVAGLVCSVVALTWVIYDAAFAADDPAAPTVPIVREAAWTAPTLYTDGTALPPEEIRTYELAVARRGEDLNADADENGLPDHEPVLRQWFGCTLTECVAQLEEQFPGGLPAEPWSAWVRAWTVAGASSEWSGPADVPGTGRIPDRPHNFEVQLIWKIPVRTP